MNEFKIKITETLEKVVTVKAESKKEALQIADNLYRSADDEYVLNGDNFSFVSMEIHSDD